jgi:hypothetical protein
MATNTESNNSAFHYNYHGTAVPVWESATTFSVAWIAERDHTNTTNLVKMSSTTVDLNISGANGILTSSTSLPGTVSTPGSGSAQKWTVYGTGTSFLSTFVVGDVIRINGDIASIVSIASNTQLNIMYSIAAVNNNVAYQRGGRERRTIYYLYAIAKPGGVDTALALSTRAVNNGDTLVDLPSDYTLYRQLPFAVATTPTSFNMTPFIVGSGWPYSPVIYYNSGANPTNTDQRVFSGTITTTGSTYSLTRPGLVPDKIAGIALLNAYNIDSGGNGLFVKTSSADSESGQLLCDASRSFTVQSRVLLDSTGSAFFYMIGGSSVREVYVSGFIVNKVP